MMETRPDGVLSIAIAVSRSGKSVWLKRAIENDSRVLVFDPKGEYVAQLGYQSCKTKAELMKTVARHGGGESKVAYVNHDKESFNYFCDVAINWNLYARGTIVCEELANVTNCGKASGHWGRLVSQGLAYGPKIIGTVQRGQEVDNSIINNASFIHVGRHSTEKDKRYIADTLGVDVSEIPDKKLEFIQWTSDRGLIVKGVIDFPASKKTKKWPEGAPRFRTMGGHRRVLSIGDDLKFKQIQYT